MLSFSIRSEPRGEFQKSSSVSLANVATMLQVLASAKKVAEEFGNCLDAGKSCDGRKNLRVSELGGSRLEADRSGEWLRRRKGDMWGKKKGLPLGSDSPGMEVLG